MAASAQEALDAIRLALEGSSNDETAIRVITDLVAQGPPANLEGTRSVELFVEAIQRTSSRVTVYGP